ncbi:MAG: response regulator [Planctomycetota bacterium]
MRILIVEDDPDQRRVLAMVFRAKGHEVTVCGSLAEARDAPRCDACFVDRRLPDGDGLAYARSLEGRVFVLTGDELDTEETGVVVLLKPLRPRQLDRLLE